jgi:hypothetical protein
LVKGLKHLIFTIDEQNSLNKIIFTNQSTRKIGNCYCINYSEFRKSATGRFYKFYKETGLKTAKSYLCKNFSQDFSCNEVPQIEISEKNLEKSFPILVKKLTKKSKTRTALFKETSSTIKTIQKEIKLKKEELAEIENLINESNIAVFRAKLDEFKRRLNLEFPETKGKNSWQNWIYENNWLFGVKYHPAIPKQKVGFDNIPDFLFPTIDGFIDILEIKKPSFKVIEEDTSHAGSYRWSPQSNEAIGQVVNYLQEMETNRYPIQEKLKEYQNLSIHAIKPRAFILIGKKDEWSPKKVMALRNLNFSLHGIEVITYSDLLVRGQAIIEMYTKKMDGMKTT